MLPGTSRAGLGAEPTAPALSDDVMETAGLKEPNAEQRECGEETLVCPS